MKHLMIHLDQEEYEFISKVKNRNGHTWADVLRAYAESY